MTDWFHTHILSLIVFVPLFTSLCVFLVPKVRWAQWIAMAGAVLTFLCTTHVWYYFDGSSSGLQFVEAYDWLPSFGIKYFIGVDGLNLLLLVLTGFLVPSVLLSLWNSKQKFNKSFLALVMLLETGMMGALVAFDMVFFYVFWELMLIPMYFIIGVWGGSNKIYATTKFVIYTVFGSLLMLIAAIVLYIFHYLEYGVYSTSLLDLYRMTSLDGSTQNLMFLAFAFAFAIKVPIWPFHTWLPHAHTEAPTSGSVILAGVLLKMGTYGFLRFALPMFPLAVPVFAPYILTLGVIGIIYGALMAWMQKDAKKLVAYSSVSHLGFVVIGSVVFFQDKLSVEALTGAVYQMINHGISTGALFFLVGMIYDRRHTRELSQFGGLASVMPWFAICLIVATLGSVGLPGTGGFIGEFLILIGVFQFNPLASILAGTGVILGAVYMLVFCLKILFGPITREENKSLSDMTTLEKSYMFPLCVLIVVMGVFPNFFIGKTKASIEHLANNVSGYRLLISDAEKESKNIAQIN